MPGEFHPEPLTEPCLTVSSHTARAIHGELPTSAITSRFLLLQVARVDHDSKRLPPFAPQALPRFVTSTGQLWPGFSLGSHCVGGHEPRILWCDLSEFRQALQLGGEG